MLERDDKDSPPDERSLLSLADRLRADSVHPRSRLKNAVSQARAERNAATRDRPARSRREPQETPLLAALESAREERVSGQLSKRPDRKPQKGWSQRTADWLGKLKPRRGPASSADDLLERIVSPSWSEPAAEAAEAPDAQPFEAPALVSAGARAQNRTETKPDGAGTHPSWTQPAPLPAHRAAVVSEAEIVPVPGGIWQPLIDPTTVLRGVVRSKWLILATTVAGALIGVVVALNTPKRYYAAAELLADPRDLNLVERELTQSGISNEATLAIVENQVRILTSGTVISKVIDRLNLARDPEFNGQGGGGLGLRALFSPFSASEGKDDPGRRYALAATNLQEKLSVQRGGKTFVIGVGVTTQDPEKSALIANTMTDVFLESYGQLQSNAAGRAATELNSKLDELRASVEAAERKVETFKAENDLIGAQGRLITDDEILKLNDQLATARAHTLELNARAASARSVNANDVLSGSLPEELASPSMQELRAQYSALKGEGDRLSVRLGPRHPQLQALQSQLAGALGLIEAEIRRISGSIQTELKRAVQLEQELSARLAQLKVRQGNLSNEMVTLRELERDATAKRAVYESFLLRARETGEQQGINSANISVISKAYPPLQSEPPSRSTMVLASTFLGLMAGMGLGVVRGTAAGLRDRLSGGGATLHFRRRRRADTMFDEEEGAEASAYGRQQVDGHPAQSEPQTDHHPAAADYWPQSAFAMPQQPLSHTHGKAAAQPFYESEPSPARRHQHVDENREDTSNNQATIEEIRSGLRECREAIRELAEQRSHRRYF